jgi:putative hemolysin
MEISIILLCLLFCAFFSGMEIAFISSNKIYLEIEKKQNNFLSQTLTKLTEKPSKFIAAMLIGNNIALVIYGFFMGDLLMNWITTLSYHFSDLSNLIVANSYLNFYCLDNSRVFAKGVFSDLCQWIY